MAEGGTDTESDTMSLVRRTLWKIESDLGRALDLGSLADKVGTSPFHMARAFRRATGMTIMAYVRARRLSEAARAIGPDGPGLLDLALEAGYGSQEAFTRAFRRHFGVPPGRLRDPDAAAPQLMEPLTMTDMTTDTIAPPRIEEMPDRTIQGLEITLDQGIGAIPGLWVRAMEAITAACDTLPETSYGVCRGENPMVYLAGMELPERVDGLDRRKLPAGRYAIWEHHGHVSELHRTFAAIWDHGLAEAGLTARDAPEFERYGRDFDPVTGRGRVEIGIAVE